MTTPNTTDKECFELCKEVYRRTGWKDTYSRLNDGNHTVRNEGNEVLLGTKEAPLYTSDYLLEKLPFHIYLQHHGDNTWRAAQLQPTELRTDFNAYQSVNSSGDTPLKALLKLVIALDDAGVKL